MSFLMKLAAFASIVLALLSAYLGLLDDVVFIGIVLCPLSFIVLCIVVLILMVRHGRSTKPAAVLGRLADDDIGGEKPVPRKRGIIVSSAILIGCFILIRTGIPRRVGFMLSLPAFERALIAERAALRIEGEPLGRFVGIYYVDRYAGDPRGGVYFRTHAGSDGIGPDTMSYGFAYRPNPRGTPFGNAHYGLMHLVGDWHVFSASNDY